MAKLPIDDVIPDLIAALKANGQAVLAAPPGAGKTTCVPLALKVAGLSPGKIVMLEPRRLAARGAADRMSATLNEPVGRTVGYRMRGATKVSRDTRIEVVTEGILTRMLQTDPELDGVGVLIFDEIHERSLNADLGLALAIEVRSALRPDLVLLPMSATLDPDAIATTLGGAPIIRSEGRAFEVETRWQDRPLPRDARLDAPVVETVLTALADTDGDVLVFLPGEADIRRVAAGLDGRLPTSTRLHSLYGAMAFDTQRAALRPDPEGRKVVLATAIAETSLTIEGVRVVIDAGLARRARFDPGSGMTRLVTERVSRAEADQRRGRAGRTAPGVAYRLWTKGEEGGLLPFPPPEIETADLSGLALDLAVWGARSPDDLALPSQPPKRAFVEAKELLCDLGAITAEGAVTDLGRSMARLPVHPRLARMLLASGAKAAPLAALLNARDPKRGEGCDLGLRLRALASPRTRDFKQIAEEARRLAKGMPGGQPAQPEEMVALAYPDRIAMRRPGEAPRFLLSGGTGAVMAPDDALAASRFLVVADTDGAMPEPKIRLALPMSESQVRDVFAGQIETVKNCFWSERFKSVRARRQDRFGALILSDANWPDAPPEAIGAAMLEGLRKEGITFEGKAATLLRRARMAKEGGVDLPDLSDDNLLDRVEDWLLPFLSGVRSMADWATFDPSEALKAYFGWDAAQAIDRIAPASWTTPLGRRIEVDYDGEVPTIALRLQELFGQTTHPTVAGQPLRVSLLSPAGRPVQVTMDLPGFWQSSYADVRKDMRGRYPKHPWPEDPSQADPTLRAKPRKG